MGHSAIAGRDFQGRAAGTHPLLIGVTTREFGNAMPPDQLRKAITDATGDLAPQALALYGLAGDGQGPTDPLTDRLAPSGSRFRLPLPSHRRGLVAQHGASSNL